MPMRKLRVPRGWVVFFISIITFAAANSAAQNTNSAQPQASTSRNNEFNIVDFGARADGKTLNTSAINAAVLAAAKVGGGTITFPAGRYRTGTFRLVSNITLQLQAGAVLEGSKELSDYGDITDYGLGRVYGTNSSGEGTKVGIVFAHNVENVSIIGPGIIDGSGDSFFDPSTPHFSMDFDPSVTRQGQRSLDAVHMTADGPIAAKPSGRPGTMIVCFDCKNVVIRDVTFRNAPNWTAHFQNVERAVISGLHVLNNPLIPNNDGFDCFGCKDVHFSDCDIHTGDDDFAIVNSVDVTVADCTLSSRSSGIRLEASQFNMFENLTIHSNRGIAVYERGFGKTDHISFANIRIETQLFTGHWWGKGEPIYIAVGKPQAGPGSGEISNVTFTNVHVTVPGGHGSAGTGVPSNNPTDYNPNSIGTRPSYGWYLHYASGIKFTDSSVEFGKDDGRPASIVNNSSDITFDHFTAEKGSKSPFDIGFQSVTGYCVKDSATTSGSTLRINTSDSTPTC